MKVTIEVPDELYREVKAKSALEGRPVRAVAEEMFRHYVGRPEGREPMEVREPRYIDGEPAPPWFGMLKRYTRDVERHDMESIRRSIARGVSEELDL